MTNSWKCEKCDKKYTKKGTLREHIKLEHENLEQGTTCVFCGNVISHSLKQSHIHRHIQEKWFKCELCDKEFFTSNQKYAHI